MMSDLQSFLFSHPYNMNVSNCVRKMLSLNHIRFVDLACISI